MNQISNQVQLNKVAIIGRANVGKSTLFNKLIEKKKAITSNIAGTTRDRSYGTVSWQDFEFQLIDTGGVDIIHPKNIEKDILKQAEIARQEADLILLLVDAQENLMPQDKIIANLLKKETKTIFLVANKADNLKLKESVTDFYQLGLGSPLPVSALNGTGTGDLLDEIVKQLKNKNNLPAARLSLPKSGKHDNQQTTINKQQITNNIRIAIIGKPNVGKSTLINAILGEERMITSPVPYTTRDSQDIDISLDGQNFTLIDTAGIRKHAKIKNRLEKFSVHQALLSIKRTDVTLLMTDVSQALSQQDKTLADEILNAQASLIIVANKWDKIKEKETRTINKFTDYYYGFFPFLKFAPIIFVSALEKQRVKKILNLAKEVYSERQRQITENALDKFLNKMIKKQPATKGKGTKHPRLFQLKQLDINPPQFELVKDYQSDLHESYLRFLENQLREKFGFLGTPVIIKVRRLKI